MEKFYPGIELRISTFSCFKPNTSYIIGESSQMEFDLDILIVYIDDSILWISKDISTYSPVYHFDDKVTSLKLRGVILM